MKENIVYTDNGIISIKAEKFPRITADDRLVKIRFQTGDEVVVEFYADHIVGLAERSMEQESE